MSNTQNKDKKYETDLGRGCTFSTSEEGEAEAKACNGCFKLHTTDWLKDYPQNLPNDIFEVRFKNTRRGYYQNVNNLTLEEGDIVAVEASPGHDIGIVSLTGDMVAKQMKRIGFNPLNGEFKKIYRKAKPYDIEKWKEAIAMEQETMIRARQIAADMNLNMKIGDVEYQGDKIKAIFYYIADERVDFRELIKVFAEQFHIRVEMKQIGARQEAGRIGGIGACGRELCCASWISSFVSVTTNAARTQDISLNPQKLAGQCSKLKCCMIYEYDDYMDARKEFPRVNEPLQTLDGDYHFIKNDILARTMSFSTAPHSMAGLVVLPISRVREIMKLNSKGIKPEKIDSENTYSKKQEDPGFVNVIGEDSITRFDNAKKKKRNKGKSNGNESNRSGDKNENRAANAEGGNRPERREERRSDRRNNDKPRDKQPERTNGVSGEENNQLSQDGNQRNNKPQRGGQQNRGNRSGNGGESIGNPTNNGSQQRGNREANEQSREPREARANNRQRATHADGSDRANDGAQPKEQRQAERDSNQSNNRNRSNRNRNNNRPNRGQGGNANRPESGGANRDRTKAEDNGANGRREGGRQEGNNKPQEGGNNQ